MLLRRLGIARFRIGGVRGGDARLWSTLKECMGSSSSSSETKLEELMSMEGRREPWKKETSGPVEVVKCCCLRGLTGDDWVS